MFKTIGGVILGYISIVVFVFFSFSLTFLLLGTERTFQPSSYEVTPLWLVASLALSLIAAIIGGKVCVIIAGRSGAAKGLAGLVLVLGILSAVMAVRASGEAPGARTGIVSNTQAMMNVREPVWFSVVMPVIGVAGVLIGGRTRSNR
jgi:hypothetical protein